MADRRTLRPDGSGTCPSEYTGLIVLAAISSQVCRAMGSGDAARHDGPVRSNRTAWLATAAVLVAASVAAALAALAAYQRGYDAEAGTRTGAEPVLAGIYVALPWVALLAALSLASVLTGWRVVACSTTSSTR